MEEKIRKNLQKSVSLQNRDAENLNYNDNFFDLITIGFGVRNFQDLEKGLGESFRVLKPNGALIVLETSVPENKIIRMLYSFFTRTYIPLWQVFFQG